MVPVNNQAYVNVCDRTPLHTWLKKMAVRRRIESRRPIRGKKLSYKISELYKQTKCRECSVHITRMDFEKMLGKFTKVKIQYDKNVSSSPLKSKYSKRIELETPDDGESARLRTIENGMVMLRRSAFKKHPAKELLALSKPVSKRISIPDKSVLKESNILNRSNSLSVKIHPTIHKVNGARKGTLKCSHKLYKIVFVAPRGITPMEKNTTTFKEILPRLNKSILPSEEWTLELLPKKDHVYDRIAAELEGLMCINQNPDYSSEKIKQDEDFPSIMDILNEKPLLDNEKKISSGIVLNVQESSLDNTKKVDSSDVEAMLTDDQESVSQDTDKHCKEDNSVTDISLIDNVALIDSVKVDIGSDGIKRDAINLQDPTENCENIESSGKVTDQSQSELQLAISGNLAESPTKKVDSENKSLETKTNENTQRKSQSKKLQTEKDSCPEILVNSSMDLNTDDSKILSATDPASSLELINNNVEQSKIENVEPSSQDIKTLCTDQNLSQSIHTEEIGRQKVAEMETSPSKPNDSKDVENNNTDLNSVTHVILKNTYQRECIKSIHFDQTLEYKVQIQHKQVEFLGAPKFISSIEDLIVLLQIVNEANIDSYNVITL